MVTECVHPQDTRLWTAGEEKYSLSTTNVATALLSLNKDLYQANSPFWKRHHFQFALKSTEEVFAALKEEALFHCSNVAASLRHLDAAVVASHLSTLNKIFEVVRLQVADMCQVTVNSKLMILALLRQLCTEFVKPKGAKMAKKTVFLYMMKTVRQLDQRFEKDGLNLVLGSVEAAITATFEDLRQTLLRERDSRQQTTLNHSQLQQSKNTQNVNENHGASKPTNLKAKTATGGFHENCPNYYNRGGKKQEASLSADPRLGILMKAARLNDPLEEAKKKRKSGLNKESRRSKKRKVVPDVPYGTRSQKRLLRAD